MPLSTIIESALNIYFFQMYCVKSIKIVLMFYVQYQWSLRFIDRDQLFSFYMMPFPINQSWCQGNWWSCLDGQPHKYILESANQYLPLLSQSYLKSNLRAALQPASIFRIGWFSVGICNYKSGYKSHDLL